MNHGPVKLWVLLPEEEQAAREVEQALLEPTALCACGHALLMHNPRGTCRVNIGTLRVFKRVFKRCPCPGFRLPEPEAGHA